MSIFDARIAKYCKTEMFLLYTNISPKQISLSDTVKPENYSVILLRTHAFPNLYAHVIYVHASLELDLSFIFFFENSKYLKY